MKIIFFMARSRDGEPNQVALGFLATMRLHRESVAARLPIILKIKLHHKWKELIITR